MQIMLAKALSRAQNCKSDDDDSIGFRHGTNLMPFAIKLDTDWESAEGIELRKSKLEQISALGSRIPGSRTGAALDYTSSYRYTSGIIDTLDISSFRSPAPTAVIMSSYRVAVPEEKLVSLKIKLAQVRVVHVGLRRFIVGL